MCKEERSFSKSHVSYEVEKDVLSSVPDIWCLVKEVIKEVTLWAVVNYIKQQSFLYQRPEAALQRCFKEKVFWKYAANLQVNTHAEVWFETLLKLYFVMGVLL